VFNNVYVNNTDIKYKKTIITNEKAQSYVFTYSLNKIIDDNIKLFKKKEIKEWYAKFFWCVYVFISISRNKEKRK